MKGVDVFINYCEKYYFAKVCIGLILKSFETSMLRFCILPFDYVNLSHLSDAIWLFKVHLTKTHCIHYICVNMQFSLSRCSCSLNFLQLFFCWASYYLQDSNAKRILDIYENSKTLVTVTSTSDVVSEASRASFTRFVFKEGGVLQSSIL